MEEGNNRMNATQTPPPGYGQPYPPPGMPSQRPRYDVHYHYYYEPPKAKAGKSIKPTLAGSLLIIHAVFSIFVAALLISGGWFLADLGEGGEFLGMEDNGDITGTVTYLNGTPAQGVTITVVDTEKTTQTDADGMFYLYNVPSGNQKIMVEKDGYNTIIYKTFVNPSNPDDPQSTENVRDFTITPGNETVEKGSFAPLEFIRVFLYVCAVIVIVASILSIIGGIYAIQRRRWGIAIIGAIAGVITLGLLPMIALFVLLISKDEFDREETTPPPPPYNGEPRVPEGSP